MPVIQPDSFSAFNLIPFQINPHYLDANPAGHAGETREQRITEYIEMNPEVYVIGLREGTMLIIKTNQYVWSDQRMPGSLKRAQLLQKLAIKTISRGYLPGENIHIGPNKLTLFTVIRYKSIAG